MDVESSSLDGRELRCRPVAVPVQFHPRRDFGPAHVEVGRDAALFPPTKESISAVALVISEDVVELDPGIVQQFHRRVDRLAVRLRNGVVEHVPRVDDTVRVVGDRALYRGFEFPGTVDRFVRFARVFCPTDVTVAHHHEPTVVRRVDAVGAPLPRTVEFLRLTVVPRLPVRVSDFVFFVRLPVEEWVVFLPDFEFELRARLVTDRETPVQFFVVAMLGLDDCHRDGVEIRPVFDVFPGGHTTNVSDHPI
jgi:hypothetical protein